MKTINASRGFTLVESIIVLVVLAIAAAGIATLSGNIFNGQDENKELQISMQLMQECAEQVLALRRTSGFDWTTNAATLACTDLAAPGDVGLSFGKPVVDSNISITDGSNGCPTGGTCRLLTIAVSTSAGDKLAPLTLLLVR